MQSNKVKYFYPIIFIILFISSITCEADNSAIEKSITTKNRNINPNYQIRENIQTYYLSPNGDDSNSGTAEILPWKTFRKAFENIKPGEQLLLLNGTYDISFGTGGINSNSSNYPNSGQPPSGEDLLTPTIIKALNPGRVIIKVPLLLGTNKVKISNVLIMDIKFEHNKNRDHSQLYNTSYITIKNTGFHGGFSIGTNNHSEGNNYNLIEDVWIWATNKRAIAVNYRSHSNVWRRVIVRSDGCDTSLCNEGAARPNIGITVYDSHDVSLQNVIVIDRVVRNGRAYSDFATAQHTEKLQFHLGRNEWLGCMSINSIDMGMYFEADNVLPSPNSIWRIKDFVSVGNPTIGINIGNKPYNYDEVGHPYSSIENATIILKNPSDNISAVRVTPGQHNVDIRDSITINATRTGFNALASTITNSAGYNPNARLGNFDIKYGTCRNCINLTSNPINDGSIIYPIKIENGSNLKRKLPKIGSNIIYSYGSNGTRFSDFDYNKISTIALWPWPNEARIKKEMCTDSQITRGFCTSKKTKNGRKPVSLTSYIFDFIRNNYKLNNLE